MPTDNAPSQKQAFPLGSAVKLDALSADPFPLLAALRESEPVSRVAALGIYFVTRYADVQRLLKDSEAFVVGTGDSLVLDIFGTHMMTVEDPEHARLKAAHQAFFLPPNIRRTLEPRIESLADALINDFASGNEIELRKHFSSRLPVQTMIELFGLDPAEESELRALYDDFEKALSNFTWDETIRSSGKAAAQAFHALIDRYLEPLRKDSGGAQKDSLLSALVRDDIEQPLSDDEIRSNAIIIFFGGISTVDALILNTLYALSCHPDALDEVRSDLSLLPKAINETIRWQGPVQSATRHCIRESQLHGVTFKPGDTVNCMLAAANRDPDMFPDPDRFDIHRPNAARHVGFAVGPHHCLGSHLARTEARIALQRLFERLPGLRLDLDRVDGPHGYEFRQPTTAVATWD